MLARSTLHTEAKTTPISLVGDSFAPQEGTYKNRLTWAVVAEGILGAKTGMAEHGMMGLNKLLISQSIATTL